MQFSPVRHYEKNNFTSQKANSIGTRTISKLEVHVINRIKLLSSYESQDCKVIF